MTNGEDTRPFYKQWRFWLVSVIALTFVLAVTSIVFGPAVIFKVLLEPSSYLVLGAAAGVVGATLTAVVKAFAPVWEELRKIRDEAETAKDEAKTAKGEAVEARSKAAVAEQATRAITIKADDNSERATFLEKSYEALSKQYVVLNNSYKTISDIAESLTNNLQKQQTVDDAKIDRLTDQLEKISQQNTDRKIEIAQLKEDHRREITELKDTHRAEMSELREQMREMGRTSTADKQEISTLQARAKQLEGRVEELEGQVKKLNEENIHLQDENRELKNSPRRRGTDELTHPTEGITSGDMVRIERVDEGPGSNK